MKMKLLSKSPTGIGITVKLVKKIEKQEKCISICCLHPSAVFLRATSFAFLFVFSAMLMKFSMKASFAHLMVMNFSMKSPLELVYLKMDSTKNIFFPKSPWPDLTRAVRQIASKCNLEEYCQTMNKKYSFTNNNISSSMETRASPAVLQTNLTSI
jgi:hypothetical protein